MQDAVFLFHQGDHGFFVVVSAEEGEDASRGEQRREAVHVAATELCRDILGKHARMLDFLSLKEKSSFLFLDDDPERLRQFFSQTVERLEAFLYALKSALNCRISIFWDFPAKLEDLGGCYRALIRRAQRHLSDSDGVISSPGVLQDAQKPSDLKTLHLHPSFLSLVAAGRREDVLDRLDAVLEEAQQLGCAYEHLLQIYHTVAGSLISDSLQRQIAVKDWGEACMGFLEHAGPGGSYRDFCKNCRTAAAGYMDFLEQNRQLQEIRLVSGIRRLVQEQLSGRLSVGSIASQCHYNAVYLSRLFKEETGVSLQDYIIRKRMEKARELLCAGEKIGDVAAAVGYENCPHFSRAFKRIFGVSPKQYQSSSHGAE